MTRAEFLKWWEAYKTPKIEAMYPKDDPHRAACIAMCIVDSLDEAKRFWNRNRTSLSLITIEHWQQTVVAREHSKNGDKP